VVPEEAEHLQHHEQGHNEAQNAGSCFVGPAGRHDDEAGQPGLLIVQLGPDRFEVLPGLRQRRAGGRQLNDAILCKFTRLKMLQNKILSLQFLFFI